MSDLAFDQSPPDDRQGWRQVRWGLWRNDRTGETWRSWRAYGQRAGHYPAATTAKRIARQARAAESRFAAQLRQVGTQINHMVRGVFDPANPDDPGWDQIDEMLRRYRALLEPWAKSVTWRLLADVSRRDAAGWHSLGREIGRGLRQEIETAPTQNAIAGLYDYTVSKILELPDQASERLRRSREFSAQIITQMREPSEAALVAGRRWTELVQQVRDAGLHVQSSAETIARTETSRAATTLQAVRAKHMGCEMFQWITSDDPEVRPLHRELGRRNVGYGMGIYRIDDPPLLDDDRPGLPGTIWNCRCYMAPILPALPE